MPYLPTLRLNSADGCVSDYRFQHNHLEFLLDNGTWRILEDADLQLHFALHTEVAKWLQREVENASHTGS